MIGDIILWFKQDFKYFFTLSIPDFFKELFCSHDYITHTEKSFLGLISYMECKKCGRTKW
jgi:hypothetical protein